jgi:hypothetical protein
MYCLTIAIFLCAPAQYSFSGNKNSNLFFSTSFFLNGKPAHSTNSSIYNNYQAFSYPVSLSDQGEMILCSLPANTQFELFGLANNLSAVEINLIIRKSALS